MKELEAYLRVTALRRGLIAALLFGLCFIGIELGLRAQVERDLVTQAQLLDDLRQEASVLRARIDAATNFGERSAQLRAVDDRFSADVDRSGVVELLTSLSAAAGTRIIHGTNRFGRERRGIVPVEQDLSIEGPYSAVAQFFESFHRIETLTLLRTVDLSANPEGSLVRVQLKLVTFSAGEG